MTSAISTALLGQYFTPAWAAEAIVERYFPALGSSDLVIEPACGPGAFLEAVPSHVPAIGIEIDPALAQVARDRSGRKVITGDFLSVDLGAKPTLILGNPPFRTDLIDGFLARSHSMLPLGGQVGFILPAYALQTAARVASYAERWSMMQEMIPRNIFPGLSKPLVFAIFAKETRRKLIGFALFQEAAAVQRLSRAYREILAAGGGPVWARVIEFALERLGGMATLQEIYAEIEGNRPTQTRFWREQIRKVLRQNARFTRLDAGRYAITVACAA